MIRAGQKLHAARLKKGLTLDEVSKITKIKATFLSAIEKGEYQKIPEKIYAQGFVQNYAEFLGLPKNEILALFRREFDEEKIYKILPEGLAKGKDFSLHGLKLQQTTIAIICIFLLLIAYILLQYRYVFLNPPLEIRSPKEGEIVSSQTVAIFGKTDSNATVYVNSDPVNLQRDGSFKKTLDLFSGKATITVKAVNRFGKETVLKRQIEIIPALPAGRLGS
ncbi:MAG: helix-turn-helix domain-containing protein [Candidatus Levybacteria bacterium]|nr:helix-turn-helix domain-containing protein [Candidatus Levybacteria bacterium]MBI3070211.1 helix-turn-helix domain-containing protein [Candidatus Levybacteria bacterium]MBI3093024.1 helix-turn-helix domain-containing protein [Candidatus Levybacteria bacterium]